MAEPRTDLAIDHQTVSASEQRTSGTELRIKLYQARPEEVLTWNFAQDPILETMAHLKFRHQRAGDTSAYEEYRSISNSKNQVYSAGAALLTASVAYPEIFTDEPRNLHAKLEGVFLRDVPKDQIANIDAPLSPDDIIKVSLNRITFKNLSYDDLYRLFIAADMLNSSASFGIPQQSPYNSRATNHLVDLFYANEIYRAIANKTFSSSDRRMQLLGLKAKRALFSESITQSRSHKQNSPENQYQGEDPKQAYKEYIEGIERVFLDTPGINLNTPENRGALHEILWLLDTNLYLDHKGENGWYVIPSATAQDAPQIGYPQGNRGYDYRVQTKSWNQRTFIQLKSKEQGFYKKKYHPLIRVVGERNFRDINPGRLAMKLRAYRRYLEQPTDEIWQQASGYILDSVREFVDEITRAGGSIEHSDRLAQAYRGSQELPKNKGARRRALKELRKD